MCGGRVDLSFVFRAFEKGADGVLICCCWPGECHYVPEGNYNAASMASLAKRLLEYAGINPDRLKLQWVTASEGIRFADTVTSFTKTVRDLGPLGSSEDLSENDLEARIQGVIKNIPYIKIAKRDKLLRHLENTDEYAALYTREEVEKLFTEKPSYYIDPEKCQGCGTCRRNCPVDAIDGDKKVIHIIDQEKCIRCGTCLEVCPPRFSAVTKLEGGVPVPPPVPDDQRAVAKKES